MEWNQLHSFRVTAQHQNISKAAQELYVTQPSLSQTIRRLEQELGYPLFEREGRHIRLNESGRVLLEAVVRMEDMLEGARLRMDELNGREHPEVSIFIGCASMLLPELLKYLRRRSPHVQYRIRQWNANAGLLDKDIRILAQPDLEKERIADKEKVELLMTERILLALPSGHPLLAKEHILLEDLAQEEFISLNENWSLGRTIRQEMNRMGFEPNVTMWVDNPNLMRELLGAHMGVAFVPAVTWHSFAGSGVVMCRVEGCDIRRKVYLQYPAASYLTREKRKCIEDIREFFRDKISDYAITSNGQGSDEIMT